MSVAAASDAPASAARLATLAGLVLDFLAVMHLAEPVASAVPAGH